MSHPIPINKCALCGHEVEIATSSDKQQAREPKIGDFVVCIECGGIGVFDEGMQIRVPTDAELHRITHGPCGDQLRRTQRAIRMLSQGRRP